MSPYEVVLVGLVGLFGLLVAVPLLAIGFLLGKYSERVAHLVSQARDTADDLSRARRDVSDVETRLRDLAHERVGK